MISYNSDKVEFLRLDIERYGVMIEGLKKKILNSDEMPKLLNRLLELESRRVKMFVEFEKMTGEPYKV